MADSTALDAALAQIDRAFGKDTAEERRAACIKVWTDRFTEECVLSYVRERVECYLRDDEDGSPFRDDFWLDLDDELERGEHRIISHPKNRIWPPFTPWEDTRLAVRRIMGWFQKPARD